ncbi:MAG: PLDc_N domain-containing protein [Desulfobacterales bacterium]|nr:PLDc_N domain-containing protein [Desulfobacterales bacterium]
MVGTEKQPNMSHALIVLILLLPMVPTFWAIVDVAHRDFGTLRKKGMWGVFIVLVPCLGGLVYLIFGRRHGTRATE